MPLIHLYNRTTCDADVKIGIMNLLLRSNQHGFSFVGIYCELVSDTLIVKLYYYRRAVRKKLSSKFDEFLAGRSQFDSDHRVDFYAPTYCLSAIFVRPLIEFVLCFLRQKNHK